VLLDGGDIDRVGGKNGRDQQRLVAPGGRRRPSSAFVQDAFVRRVHVDEDQAAAFLRRT
jgi:hypothetical protein